MDINQPALLGGPNSPQSPSGGRRRGRPPGAKSKRSLDLARYIEATFAGQTPGQQSAALCMVTPRDLKNAKAEAREHLVIDLDLDPLTLAMVVKAAKLARALGINRAEAWVLLMKERDQLMPYVHQKRPAASDDKGKPPAELWLIAEGGGPAMLPDLAGDPDDAPLDFIEVSASPGGQVSRPKSHGPV